MFLKGTLSWGDPCRKIWAQWFCTRHTTSSDSAHTVRILSMAFHGIATAFWTLYVCNRENKQQRLNENTSSVVWGLVDLWAAKCSCMLSAVGHLGYCRFQQKMMKARASWGGKWGLGGHSLAVSSWPESTWLSVVFFVFFYLLSSRLHSVTAALHILNYSWSAHCTNVYLCTCTPTIIDSFVGGKGA